MPLAMLTTHPLQESVADLRSVLDAMEPRWWDSVPPGVAADLASDLMVLASRVQAQAACAVRRSETEKVARRRGNRSATEMLSAAVGHDRSAGSAVASTAKAVVPGSATEAAMLSGSITARHAAIVGRALADLPTPVTEEQRQLAERTLIRDARRFSPSDLLKRGRRVCDAFAPKPTVDATEDELLARRDERAIEKLSFSLSDRRDGTWAVSAVLPELEAAMLKAAVDAYAAPRRHDGPHDPCDPAQSTSRRLGRGFAELITHLDPRRLPEHGGINATVLVTMTLDSLTKQLQQAGTIVGGERITAAEARRLACTASLIPVVLGKGSQPLDLGRTQRLFTPSQRKAIMLRDQGCTYPDCDVPASWCEVHHFTHNGWRGGGETNLDEGALECSVHHSHVERESIPIRLRDNGVIEHFLNGSWRHNARWRPPPD